MDYKPDQNTLIAYLYGEIDADTQQKVEAYLAQNPDAQKELEGLKSTRNLLQQWKDIPVNPPVFMVPPMESKNDRFGLKKTGRVLGKTGLIAAACLTLLMILGSLLKIQISYTPNQFTLSFGEVPKVQKDSIRSDLTESQTSLNEKRVNTLIVSSLAQNNDSLLQYIQHLEKHWQEQMRVTQGQQSLAITKQDLPQLIQEIKEDNLNLLGQLLELNEEQQKTYTQDLFIAFSEFLEEQRLNDLYQISKSINEIEKDAIQNQEATNLFLSQIVQNFKTEKP